VRRVTVERYEDEAPGQIMVYGTDELGVSICFRVTGESVESMRETIDSGLPVEVELPDSAPKLRLN